jgi:MFS transporter, SP family, general alpha glucoside:H+ symporter
MALNSMFIIGTVASWCLLPYFGRRTLYIAGLVCMDIVLLVAGIMGWHQPKSTSWASGTLIVLNFIYNATLGPVCYTIISEVGSTRLRAKTIVLARCAYAIVNMVCGIIVPRMLGPAA